MLSKRDRRCGRNPNSSYELGRGRRRRELAPSASLWNRPRGGGGGCCACCCCRDPLPILEEVPGTELEPVPAVCSLDEQRSTESDSEEEGAFKGLGEGTYSPDDDTTRGNGIAAATNESPPPLLSSSDPFVPFAPSSGLHRLGTYTPFLFPAVMALLRVLLFLRSPTRLEPGPEPPPSVITLSGLDSRGSSREESRGCGASPGVSTLCRARCVGRRPLSGESTRGDDGEAKVGKAPKFAMANSSWSCPVTRGFSAERDTVNED